MAVPDNASVIRIFSLKRVTRGTWRVDKSRRQSANDAHGSFDRGQFREPISISQLFRAIIDTLSVLPAGKSN